MINAALVITYARKDNAMLLVEQLINSGIKTIYVSIDGPKDTQIRELQTLFKTMLQKKQEIFSGEILVWQRELNMGSGASVVASLDWVFSSEESCHVLEDDLVVTEDFFTFMNYGLEQMSKQSNLKIVTGTNPFENMTDGKMGKVNYPVSWGWATNRANWKDLRDLIFNGSPKKVMQTKIRKRQYWEVGRKRALLGRIEAWDVPLASEMYKTTFYTLIPPVNLVRNKGFDQYAAHTSESIWPLDMPVNELPDVNNYEIIENQLVDLNENFENRIFKITGRHAVSWLTNFILDKFRFKRDSVPLSVRCHLERFPSK